MSRNAALRSRCETALKCLRAAIESNDFGAALHVSDGRMGWCPTLAELKLTGETDWTWQLFFREDDDRRHDWFQLSTEDRLGYVANIEALLESLRGQHLTVQKDISWRWDHHNPYADGRARYIPRYAFTVHLRPTEDGAGFDPAPVLAAIQATTCAARDARADEHLFDFQRERGVDLFGSYRWTVQGFQAVARTKAAAERVVKELFADCRCTLQRNGDGKKREGWVVAVDFPA